MKLVLNVRKTVRCSPGFRDELRSGASPGTLSKAKACQNSEGVAAMQIHTCSYSRPSHLVSSHLIIFTLSVCSSVVNMHSLQIVCSMPCYSSIIAAQAPARGLALTSSHLCNGFIVVSLVIVLRVSVHLHYI